MSDIENYYNIKKFISNVRILKAKRSDRISEEQTGIDRIIYLIEKIIASFRNSYIRQDQTISDRNRQE